MTAIFCYRVDIMFHRKKITNDMTIVKILSENPLARGVLLSNGIKFIGKGLSPLESLEKVAKGNGLTDAEIEKILSGLNREQPKRDDKNILDITDMASEKLKQMIKAKHKKGIRLRMVSDGCSTYVYDMDFGTKKIEGEVEFRTNDVVFYIEPKSVDFIKGTKIDYSKKEDGFIFDNPNVKIH